MTDSESKLPLGLSKLRTPTVGMKREAQIDPGSAIAQMPESKRIKPLLNGSSKPAPPTFEAQPPPMNTLRRAKSSANLSMRAKSTENLAARKPLVSTNKPSAGTTTANKTLTTSRSGSRIKSEATSTSGAIPGKAPPKWDLKGRLENLEAKFTDSESNKQVLEERVKLLESKNTYLESDCTQKEQFSQNLQKELDDTHNKLRESKVECGSLKASLNSRIGDLEFQLSQKERQYNSLSQDFEAQSHELANLKRTVADLATANSTSEARINALQAEIEAERTITRCLSEAKAKLEEQTVDLLSKLRAGEVARRKLHCQVQDLKGNIRVFCRVRPVIPSDKMKSTEINHLQFEDSTKIVLTMRDDGNESAIGKLRNQKSRYDFAYDKVFGPRHTQSDIFEELSQLVQSALDGYNVSVFAYGQTGSGKTHTMEGGDNIESEGMIPRTVRQIFRQCKDLEDQGWVYGIEASFIEIYNETIRDLLGNGTSSGHHEIRMVGPNSKEVYVSNTKKENVTSESEVYRLLATAQKQRAVAATACNERSSRSHSIFQLKIVGENSVTAEKTQGILSLVDLAGSERLKESQAAGDRLVETQNINKSLAQLGNVIAAIAEKREHIPYRDCKLTHLLMNSLGSGNSKTLMFVNVSPIEKNANETLNSLNFAAKVNSCHIGVATSRKAK